MKTQTLIRWSGLALLLAGVLYLLSVLHPPNTLEGVLAPAWVPVHFVISIHHLLLVFGLIGLYAFQMEKAGRLGLIAFLLTGASNAMFPTYALFEATLQPTLAANPATQSLADPAQAGTFGIVILAAVVVQFVGYVLFGIVIIRAGVLPRWPGLLIMVGWTLLVLGAAVPALALAFTISLVLVGLGLAWCGYEIWSSKSEMTA